jgi:hypothetical protein
VEIAIEHSGGDDRLLSVKTKAQNL